MTGRLAQASRTGVRASRFRTTTFEVRHPVNDLLGGNRWQFAAMLLEKLTLL